MKRWQLVLPTALIGLSLITTSLFPLYAQTTDAEQQESEHSAVSIQPSKKIIHLYSNDFPQGAAASPSPPATETRFWQSLDRAMKENGSMTLTENLEEADYRVELRCSGIIKCTSLRVDIKSPQRDILTSFNLRGVTPVPYLTIPNMEKVAKNLTMKLDERLKALEQGGYGFYKE